jgi:NAD(P)-dependent dehydrogenase (short-subunit alcohol dehydrogenase family)
MQRSTPVAFVTGASRGIGRCGALALARAGYDVVCTARTLREGEGRAAPSSITEGDRELSIPGSLETTVAEIEALGREALAIRLDITDRVSIGMAYQRAIDTWGRIDVLFNNGIYQGPGTLDRFLDLRIDLAEKIVAGNYLNQLLLTQLVIPQMLERGRGHVINMTSASATEDPVAPAGDGGWGVGYSASKAAFSRLIGILHVEFFGRGIRAFNVDPGFVITEKAKATGSAQKFSDAGYRGAPAEVPGEVIGWLASAPEADEHAGTTVIAQRLCKKLGLVPGWPPPR